MKPVRARAFVVCVGLMVGVTARAEFSTQDVKKGRVPLKESPLHFLLQQPPVYSLGAKAQKKTDRKIARSLVMDCPPSNSAEDLTAWRDQAIQKIYEQPSLSGTYDKDLSDIQATIDRCWPSGVPSCLEDLSTYARTLPRSGAVEPEYAQSLSIRSPRDLPQEFWVRDSAGNVKPDVFKLPENLQQLAQRGTVNGTKWNYALHRTRGDGGFENGPNLLMITAETPKTNFVLQIEVPRDPNWDARKSSLKDEPRIDNGFPIPLGQAQYMEELKEGTQLYPNVVTMITADKTKTPAVGSFYKFARKMGSTEIPWSSNSGDYVTCVGCHATPYRNISPVGYKNVNGSEKRMTPAHEAHVDAVNQLMESVSPLSWGTAKRGDKIVDFGPPAHLFPLGWNPRPESRTREYIDSCKSKFPSFSDTARGGIYSTSFQQTDPGSIRHEKVAQAMNCTMCHNGSYRGPITPLFNDSQVHIKILVDRMMPPTATDLTVDERLALIGCLMQEREELRDEWYRRGEWLKKAQCKPSSGVSPSRRETRRLRR